jgi:hypothetical protein
LTCEFKLQNLKQINGLNGKAPPAVSSIWCLVSSSPVSRCDRLFLRKGRFAFRKSEAGETATNRRILPQKQQNEAAFTPE